MGAMVAVYPIPAHARALAIPGGEAPERLHVTLAYLGKRPQTHVIAAAEVAADRLSSMVSPFTAKVTGTAVFDTDDGDVLVALLQAPELEAAGHAMASFRDDQYPTWIPHVTLGYGLTPDRVTGLPDRVRFDRVVLARDDVHVSWPLGEAARLAKMLGR